MNLPKNHEAGDNSSPAVSPYFMQYVWVPCLNSLFFWHSSIDCKTPVDSVQYIASVNVERVLAAAAAAVEDDDVQRMFYASTHVYFTDSYRVR